jgi:hypothetical protein
LADNISSTASLKGQLTGVQNKEQIPYNFKKTNSITEPSLDQSEKGKSGLRNEDPSVTTLSTKYLCEA